MNLYSCNKNKNPRFASPALKVQEEISFLEPRPDVPGYYDKFQRDD
jgi:hypothetical protein